MRGLILLGLAGAGLWYAEKRGLLPQLSPVVDEVERRVAQLWPASYADVVPQQRFNTAQAVQEASGGRIVPVLGPDEVIETNVYEGMLRQHMRFVSGWARANIGWAAAICKVENGPRNPKVSGDNGTSHGVLQVKVATAQTCARAGYNQFPPTRETLLTYEGGIYFGTAEMERLAGINPDRDWIIKAYNGGAGWQQMPSAYQRAREAYLVKVRNAFTKLYAGEMA